MGQARSLSLDGRAGFTVDGQRTGSEGVRHRRSGCEGKNHGGDWPLIEFRLQVHRRPFFNGNGSDGHRRFNRRYDRFGTKLLSRRGTFQRSRFQGVNVDGTGCWASEHWIYVLGFLRRPLKLRALLYLK